LWGKVQSAVLWNCVTRLVTVSAELDALRSDHSCLKNHLHEIEGENADLEERTLYMSLRLRECSQMMEESVQEKQEVE